jgi:uncharacterized membrane protein YjgN (DUF898 family)
MIRQAYPEGYTVPIKTGESYFDGGLLELIGYRLIGLIITVLTLGICTPWAICLYYEWEVNHTLCGGTAFASPVRATSCSASGSFGSCSA